MDCSSFGSPIPNITWWVYRAFNRGKCYGSSTAQRNGLCASLRFKESRSSTLDGDPYILHDNGTLEIHVAQARNTGKYTCVARNSLGIYENHVYLEVKGESVLKVWNDSSERTAITVTCLHHSQWETESRVRYNILKIMIEILAMHRHPVLCDIRVDITWKPWKIWPSIWLCFLSIQASTHVFFNIL